MCGRTTLLMLVIVAAAGQGLRGRRRNAPNQRRRYTHHAASSSRHPLCLQANRAWKLDWTRRRGLRMILQIGCSRVGWTKTTERLTCCTRGRPRGPPNLPCGSAILAMTVPRNRSEIRKAELYPGVGGTLPVSCLFRRTVVRILLSLTPKVRPGIVELMCPRSPRDFLLLLPLFYTASSTYCSSFSMPACAALAIWCVALRTKPDFSATNNLC